MLCGACSGHLGSFTCLLCSCSGMEQLHSCPTLCPGYTCGPHIASMAQRLQQMLEELLAGRKARGEVDNVAEPAARPGGRDEPKAMLAGDESARFADCK